MKQPDPTLVQSASDREIVVSRVFDAPRALVWEAWTTPEHIAQWWGPRGFSTTIEEFDLRPGGRFKHVMHGPDGADYPNLSVFKEVVAPERIAYSHGGGRQDGVGAHFDAIWTFEPVDESRTRVTGRLVFESAQARDLVVREFGAIEGGKQTLARLAEHIAHTASAGEEIVLVRDFAFPRERVFEAWTRLDHLRHWWGPQGFDVVDAKLDLRVGGTFHYRLRAKSGEEMWGKFVFSEVRPPERLAWVNSFSDPAGTTARHPAHVEWPLEMQIEVTFVENYGGTTLTLRSRALHASESERKTFREGHDSMRGGFGGSFDRLEGYLLGERGPGR